MTGDDRRSLPWTLERPARIARDVEAHAVRHSRVLPIAIERTNAQVAKFMQGTRRNRSLQRDIASALAALLSEDPRLLPELGPLLERTSDPVVTAHLSVAQATMHQRGKDPLSIVDLTTVSRELNGAIDALHSDSQRQMGHVQALVQQSSTVITLMTNMLHSLDEPSCERKNEGEQRQGNE